MNKVVHVPYLRHRWSTKSGGHFRCLRRGCTADQPSKAGEVCRPWDWPLANVVIGFKPFTHGGGENLIFGGPHRPRRLAAPKSISGEITVRATLENPKRRNRNSRRKRRDRARAEAASVEKFVRWSVGYGMGLQKFRENLALMDFSLRSAQAAVRRFRELYPQGKEAGLL